MDLTLVASTTLGQSLRGELAGGSPVNLLVSGEVLEEMARREPATLTAMQEAVQQNQAALVGGEFTELELPLLPPEAIRYQLEKGIAACQRHLGVRPTVFGRRRFGLSPVLPQILEKLGFIGAAHFTLDDGRFPIENQSRIRWEGLDGTVLEALARVPVDAVESTAFFNLPQNLGGSMDSDRAATAVFAHWPGRRSPWYDDLRRITQYTAVAGSFATIPDFFRDTGMAGQTTQYKADQYRSPYLVQAVDAAQADPISRWVRYYGQRATAEAAEALDTLGRLVAGSDSGRGAPPASETALGEVEESLVGQTADDTLDRRLQTNLQQSVERFSRSVSGGTAGKGVLLANPCSFSRRVCLELPELARLPDVAGPVQAAAEAAGRKAVIVELPAMGFAWVGPGSGETPAAQPAGRKWGIFPRKSPAEPPLAEQRVRQTGRWQRQQTLPDTVLRNEFFEIAIDPGTGAIRAISDYKSRGPRLAQQIALRGPQAGKTDESGDDPYSKMVADEVRITCPGPVLGEVVARGRLVDERQRRLAGFRQTTRVWRGSRVIELLIELLDVDELPGPDPWNSYYAARFAWSEDGPGLRRSVNMANLATDATQLEAPHFLEIRGQKVRTTLLTAGLPYHRRFGLRKLDTLLIVRGETARQFRLGIALDLSQPMAAALDFLAPRTIQPGAAAPKNPSSWLFHLDARSVVATHWAPLPADSADGALTGFRARLLETEGRQVQLGLRSFRGIQSARKLGPDNTATDLPVEGDRITLDLRPHEWVEVEGRFAG